MHKTNRYNLLSDSAWYKLNWSIYREPFCVQIVVNSYIIIRAISIIIAQSSLFIFLNKTVNKRRYSRLSSLISNRCAVYMKPQANTYHPLQLMRQVYKTKMFRDVWNGTLQMYCIIFRLSYERNDTRAVQGSHY